jgi:hypothetical protein
MTSLLNRVKAFFAGKEVHEVLSAVDQVVAIIAPSVEADIKAFIATLPDAFASLEAVAVAAIKIVSDVKGVTINKTIAIALAQKVFAQNDNATTALADDLLTKLVA